MIPALIAAIAVFLIQEYRYAVVMPVKKEKSSWRLYEWFDFIKENIKSTRTEEQCVTLTSLINLYDRYFRGNVATDDLEKNLEELWSRLDVKYRLIHSTNIEIGTLTIDDLIDSQ